MRAKNTSNAAQPGPGPDVDAILKRLRRLGSAKNRAGMARYGIPVEHAFGVPLTPLREMARQLGRNQDRAEQLWATGVREARLLAIFTAEPQRITLTQAGRWVRTIQGWDLCDGFCNDLIRKTPVAWQAAWKWARQKPEFVRRAGFSLFACLAVHDKRVADEVFLEVLPLIEETADDDRNFVRKAVNWALRQIGKRNPVLCAAATETALRMAGPAKSASSRWIAKDALREFAQRAALEKSRKSSR